MLADAGGIFPSQRIIVKSRREDAIQGTSSLTFWRGFVRLGRPLMKQHDKHIVGWLSEWRRFSVLLALLFAVRGVLVICVLPPFEGWDEYQHLAYIVHLIEKGSPPDLAAGSIVPRSMYPWLAKYPHCRFGTDQLRPLGAQSYDEYWNGAAAETAIADSGHPDAAPDVPIYQAQHPSLYYRMMVPVVRRFLPDGDLLTLVGLLRLINIGFGSLSVYLVARLLGRLIKPSAMRYLLGLLIALQPLYLLNCARVASDALAVLLGTAAIGLILWPMSRYRAASGAAAGAATGLAILTKTVNLALAPFGILAGLLFAWRDRVRRGTLIAAPAAFLVGLVAICGWYFFGNLKTFGLLTPMQEAVHNRAAGRGLSDMAQCVMEMDLVDELGRRFYRRSLWTGGWSYLAPPIAATRIQEYSYYFASLGFLFALGPTVRRSHSISALAWLMPTVALLCALSAAGLSYHMIHTKMLLGSVATNIWYAAVIFPWLLVLYAQGLAYWPIKWVGIASGLVLAATFLGAEIYGTLVTMVSTYSGGATGIEAWRRIGELHPGWLNPYVAGAALGGVGLLVSMAVGIIASAHSRSRPEEGILTS